MARSKSQRLRKRPRVALIVETSNSYARGLLDGVADYIRDHQPWSVYLPEQGRGGGAPDWLRGWDGDGVIARIENEAVAARVNACQLPAVDVSAARILPELPWVETDDREIAELAFGHLAERGFHSRRSDIAVPEEVAVLGVDNDDILCRLADPPLSSVIPDTHRTGYEAAALLDRMMSGERIEPEGHLVRPRGIETRQSTDVLAIADPAVTETLRFIREHACDGISVKDVLARSRLSRRVLESRFRGLVGRSPHEELLRVRVARVKFLLCNTDLTIAEFAERTGYEHIEYLSAQFTRLVGQPPSQFRNRNRR